MTYTIEALTKMAPSITEHFGMPIPVEFNYRHKINVWSVIEDMPDVLQHWNKYEPYVGNHILNRIDPLEWMIENPWLELNTKIQIHLSKRAFNNLKKLEKPIITLNSAVIDAPWKKERE